MTANDRYQSARSKADGWAWTADSLGSARRDALDIGADEFAAKVKALEDEARENYEKWDNRAGELKPAADREFQRELDFAIADDRRCQ